MKTYFIAIVLGLLFIVTDSYEVNAQQVVQEKTKKEIRKEKKALRKEKKEAKKAERKALEEIEFKKAMLGLEENKWVLEAHTLYSKRGRSVPVTSTTNFVAMEGDEIYVQLAFDGMIGPNGLGGITLKGRPTKHELTQDEKGNVLLRMSVIGVALTADITIRMGSDGNYATAEVSSLTRSRRIEFSGVLLHMDESSYFKSGMDL